MKLGNFKKFLTRKNVYAAIFLAYYFYVISQISGYNQRFEGYRLGDWLVNYSQGFVRRGFLGNLFFALWDWFQIPLALSVTVFEALVTAVFFYFVWFLVTRNPLSLKVLLLFAFPMGFFYALGEFRATGLKENLLFATLALVYLFRDSKLWSWRFALLLAVWAMVILSHEGMIFYSVYPMALLYFTASNRSKVKTRTAIFGAVGFITAAITALFGFGSGVVNGLCNYMVYGGHLTSAVCRGTVRWLSRDASEGFTYVQERINPGFVTSYLIAGTVLLATIWFATRRLNATKVPFWQISLAGWVSAAPIFFVASDWGRWLMIHAVCTTVLVLAVRNRQGASKEVAGLSLGKELLIGAVWVLSWSVTLGGGLLFSPLVRF